MLLDRIDKADTDQTRAVLDMTWWLDPGEVISQVVSAEVIQGMSGWSEAPYPPRGDLPPPYDPTPVLMPTVVLDASQKQLVVFVEFGTPGVAYTCQFVLEGTSARRITVELGVQVTGVPLKQPMPLPPPPSEAAGQGPVAAYVNIEGATMKGPFYLVHDPQYPTEAATKAYVDALIAELRSLLP